MFDTANFREKMATLDRRHEELGALLSTAEVIHKRAEFMKLSREHAELDPLVAAWKTYEKLLADLAQAKQMADAESDAELRELARDEAKQLEDQRGTAEHELKILLLPKDPNDGKNAILEIRGGTGGDEAALFAGDLYRMYTRFAERQGWKLESMSLSEGTSGGFKEVIVLIDGKDVFSKLKFESGVHRVQRVPATEAQGRIHTSAATVAVLPEAEEVDVKIDEKDLKIDTYRSSGAGGQHVNVTDSAIRITHFPSGIVVSCQNERSQHRNKDSAMRVLKSRLYDIKIKENQAKLDQIGGVKKGIGFGSQIRSYVLQPYQMIKDHRTKMEVGDVSRILDYGDLDPFIKTYLLKKASGTLGAPEPADED